MPSTDPPEWQTRNKGKAQEAWDTKDQRAPEKPAIDSAMIAKDQPKPRPKPPILGQSVDREAHARRLNQDHIRVLAANSQKKAQTATLQKSQEKEHGKEIEK